MRLRTRRLLYLGFIIIFLIATPLVWLYAAGYKLAGGFNIQKTGMLIIKSDPSAADVYIDEELQKKFLRSLFSPKKYNITTPAKIQGLIPGDYQITIAKSGFWPWKKKLAILPGQTTFAEDITLFKKDIPLLLYPGKQLEIKISPNEKFAAIFSTSTVSLFNLETNSPVSTADFAATAQIEKPVWLDNDFIQAGSHIFSKDNWLDPINTEKIAGVQMSKAQINPQDKDSIYYLLNSKLFNLNYKKKINSQIIKDFKISNYQIKNNFICFISQNETQLGLGVWDIGKSELIRNISLPVSQYELVNPGHDLINLLDIKHDILYLVDPFSPINPLRDTINNINKTSWITNNKLLYANDFEIWLYDLGNFNKILLTRISDKITDIFWHPNNGYIIYATEKSLTVIELDDREKHNITKILSLEKISSPYLGRQGDAMYFYGDIKSQNGIFMLAL